MYHSYKIGDKELILCTSAVINLCFWNIFHEDFMKAVSDSGLATTTMMKMAFVMAKYGELNNRKKVNQLSEEDFEDWLEQFEIGDLMDALPGIQDIYMKSGATQIAPKKK